MPLAVLLSVQLVCAGMTVIAGISTGFVITLVVAYFTPTFVAVYRGHHQTAAIVVINVFLGWTFLGWVVALAMAFTAVRAS